MITRKCLSALLLFTLAACTNVPPGIAPIDNFELDRYLGDWYEIARLDHSFERGLSRVSASYLPLDGGGVRVVNKGYDKEEQRWKSAEGKAHFVGDKNLGHLKVSFFGPFYGSYIVFKLDSNYQYAFVTGYNRNYLWLLARTPQVSHALIDEFKRKATALGFELDTLVMVEQTPLPATQ